MSKKFSFVFPGQGSQQIKMLNDLSHKYPIIKDTFKEASLQIGYDLWNLAQEGPEQKLNQTQHTQPVLLAAGVALWRLWQNLGGPLPSYLAGHSLGEYTALVCADALDFRVAIDLVSVRGQYMQEAVPLGEGAMAAIIGLNEVSIKEICTQATEKSQLVAPANFNSIDQIVVAGHVTAVERAIIIAKERGARLTIKLPMSVPSHSILMKPAAIKLEQKLKTVVVNLPKIPVVNNVDVTCYQQPDQILDALVRQLYSPVRWVDTIQFFATQQINLIIECGPGKILSGLNKRTIKDISAISLSQPDSFQEALGIFIY